MSDEYTADEIVWRGSTFVGDECISYVAQLGYKYGSGGMMILGAVQHGDNKWYATIETYRKFSYGPCRTANEAKLEAIKLAKHTIVGISAELVALEKNTKPKQIAKSRKKLT
jgi:hypothetical protein